MLTKDDCSLSSFNEGAYTRYVSPWGEVLWYESYAKAGQIHSVFVGGSTCDLEKQYKASLVARKITNWLRLK